MGNFLLLTTVLSSMVLLLASGTNAAQSSDRPTGHELKNITSDPWKQRFFDRISPLDGTPGATTNYFAGHQTVPGSYYGFMVTMDVYGLSLTSEQTSAASVSIINEGDGAPASLNAIQIGWEVKPSLYGDSRTHLAAIWTTDGFQKTGCPNKCPGFQSQSGANIALGDVIEHVSQPGGAKQTITVKVVKDKVSGDWLVHYGLNQQVDPALIGRFPKSLFTGGLTERATSIRFSGFVQARGTVLAPMGSGYLPTKPTAASMSEINLFDKDGHATRVTQDLPTYVSHPDSYGVTNMKDARFFYGGPSQPKA